MTSAPKIRAKFLTAIGADHTGAGAAYSALGTPLSEAPVSFIISSTYDQPVFLSIDGTNDQIFVPIDKIIQIGLSENKQNVGRLQLAVGTQFFLKQGPDGAPTTGDLFISFIYPG